MKSYNKNVKQASRDLCSNITNAVNIYIGLNGLILIKLNCIKMYII